MKKQFSMYFNNHFQGIKQLKKALLCLFIFFKKPNRRAKALKNVFQILNKNAVKRAYSFKICFVMY